MKNGVVIVGSLMIFGLGFLLGTYLSHLSNEEMTTFIEEEALRLVCDTSYQQDMELLRYYLQVEQDIQSSSCSDEVIGKIPEVNALLKKKVAVLEEVCEK